jgi:predicted CXXCH cytochrome family protein
MKQKSVVILFLFITLILIVVYCMEREPHKFSQAECRSCHMTDASGNIEKDMLTESLVTLCERCHAKILSEGYLHPINVRPRNVRVPAGFPLSRYGEITCSTCHDIHSSYFTPYGTPSHFLRQYETGSKFCEACHSGSSLKIGHAEAIEEAHFQTKYVEISSSQLIDPISRKCISCHDGAYASSVSIRAGMWSHSSELISNDDGDHPIGTDYESARISRGKKTDLRPIDLVDPRIQFFDGKIGCGSCHDPYSSTENNLVMSDRNSQLCLSCHVVGK